MFIAADCFRPRRLSSAVLTVVTAVALALVLPAAAQAAGTTGWRVVATTGSANVPSQMMAVTAVAADNAWAFGRIQSTPCTPECPYSLIARHWNGRSWQAVRLPASVRQNWPGALPMAAGSSSADNVWVFGTQRWARWNGHIWTGGTMPQDGATGGRVMSTVVLSSSNVWALGTDASASMDAYIAHFDGQKWHVLGLPFYYPGITSVSAIGPGDIWASSSSVTNALLHWNGRSWRQVLLPSAATSSGNSLAGVIALTRDSIWVTGLVPGSGSGPSVPGALHWNRLTSTWKIYRLKTSAPLIEPSSDGHGGVWAVAQAGNTALQFWHWSSGRWSPSKVPDAGAYAFVGDITSVLRTSSLWAVGVSRIGGSLLGSILLHGTRPH